MKADLNKAFMYKAKGPLKEFVGSKIGFSRNEKGLGTAKFTQPVLVCVCQLDLRCLRTSSMTRYQSQRSGSEAPRCCVY